MPKAGGLDDVTQRFLADNTQYRQVALENVELAQKMSGAVRETTSVFDDMSKKIQREVASSLIEVNAGFTQLLKMSRAAGMVSREFDDIGLAIGRMGVAQAQMQNMQQNLVTSTRELTAAQKSAADLAVKWKKAWAESVVEVAAAQKASAAEQKVIARAFATEQKALAAEVLAVQNQVHRQMVQNADSENRMINLQVKAEKEYQAVLGQRATVQAKTAQAALRDQQALQAEIERTGAATRRVGLATEAAMTAYATRARSVSKSIIPDALAVLAASGNDNTVGGVVDAAAALRNAAGGGTFSGTTGAILMNRLMAGDGGGGGGSGGGGGGFFGGLLGGVLGGGGGGFGLGSSAAIGAKVNSWIGTWYPRFHWAMMLTNEVLATVGPAAVAAGAAGFVGMEAATTGYQRLSAINNVGQSLGPALGQTPGQFLGLGNALQRAQTIADPTVWELMGSAIRDVQLSTHGAAGGLSNFWQLGTNTIDMIDRFAAKVTTAFQGGAGKQLNALVGGGTADLQQFGDVLGNIGTTFLHVAPALPGVGGDLLGTLQAVTRGISNVTGLMPTTMLGTILAGEAGSRYGPGMVGSVADLLGKVPGTPFGAVARAATADDVAAVAAGIPDAAIGLETGVGVTEIGQTIGGSGLAGALGATGGVSLAAAAAAAYLTGKTITAQSPTQQWVGRLQQQANQASPGQAFGDLVGNMNEFGSISGGQQGLNPIAGWWQGAQEMFGAGKGWSPFKGMKDSAQSLISLLGGPGVRTSTGTANVALQNAANQFNDLLAAGPAMQAMLGGGSLSNAYSLADMAGLQGSQLQTLVTAKPGSKAYDDIRNQLLNAQAGFKVMAASPGVYGGNVQAVQAMAGLQGTKLSSVNTAWDQILSNATTGTGAATGFAGGLQNFQMLGGSLQAVQDAAAAAKLDPTQVKQSASSLAKALAGFSSPAAQQAWAAWSSPSTSSPGLLQQVGTMADWARTAMTVTGGEGFGQSQFNTIIGSMLKQALPNAKGDPAALAQAAVLTQQMGWGTTKGPGYDPGKSAAWNYNNMQKFLGAVNTSGGAYNAAMTAGTEVTSGVSTQAMNFGATMQANTYAALAGGATSLPKVAADRQKLMGSVSAVLSGGSINTGAYHAAAASIAADLASVGTSAASAKVIVADMLQGKGLSAGQLGAIVSTVVGDLGKIQSKNIRITTSADLSGAHATAAAMAAIVDKTVIVKVINETIYETSGHATISGSSPLGRYIHAQTGGLVPGWGSGDTVPAMLEPGEAVIPRWLVPQLRPFLRQHGIPGFAAGGIVPASTLSGVDAQLKAEFKILDAMYASKDTKAQIDAFWKTVLDPLYAAKDRLDGKTASTAAKAAKTPQQVLSELISELNKPDMWKQVGVTIVKGITSTLKTPGLVAATQADASVLGHKIQAAFNLARGVAGAALAGQGYGTAGLISGYNVTPGSGGGTLLEQMQSYLGSEKSFTKDIRTLRKQHLSKALIAQMIAAGPVQGDALAQSVLQDYGGVKAVNAVWNQIGQASKGLGAQAAMAQYGGYIAPNLKSGTFTSANITINVNAPGGGTGNLPLTTSQINALVRMIQAKLLEQAKRNNKTGTKAKGKGS